MKEFTPPQKLDLILHIFSSKKEAITFKQLDELLNTPQYGTYIDRIEMLRIIKKLLDDKYVVEEPISGLDQMGYHISFDGYLFKGYEVQKKIDDQNAINYVQNEKRIIRNERLLIVGTWAAAIVGLLVLCWYIYTYFHPSPTFIILKK